MSALSSFMNITGLQKYQNSIAQGCSWGSIAKNGLVATGNLAAAGSLIVATGGWATAGFAAEGAAELGAYSVYQGVDDVGIVRYVGMTGRTPAVRFSEHVASNTAKSELTYSVQNSGLTQLAARNAEQDLIDQYGLSKNGGQLLNKINSIRR